MTFYIGYCYSNFIHGDVVEKKIFFNFVEFTTCITKVKSSAHFAFELSSHLYGGVVTNLEGTLEQKNPFRIVKSDYRFG